ncbi:MAG: lipopolysaccharide biosynthesis protein [Nannocystaceae bacterium]|nr:hypothetical protein [bacterium]
MNAPARPRPFAFSLSWTLVGEVLFAGGQFGMLVIMARLGSETVLGQYALGLAIATPLYVLTSLHLRPTFIVSDRDTFAFGHYLALRLVGTPLTLVAVGVWSYFAAHDPGTRSMVLMVALVRFSELISDILHAAPSRAEHLRHVGISRALRGVSLVLSVALCLASGATPLGALGVGAAVGAAVTLLYDLPIARRYESTRPRFEPETLRKLTWLAAPVGMAGALLGLTQNMPAYVLEHVGSVAALGRYTAAVSILFVSGVLNMAVGAAAVPRLARHFEASAQTFARFLVRVVAVVAVLNACVLLGCVLVGDLYLRIAYGAPMAALHTELIWAGGIAIAAGVANLLSQTVVATRSFRIQFGVSLSGLLVAALLALTLVPRYGLFGALMTLGGMQTWRLSIYAVTVALLVRTRRRAM